ncbi:hypothetical protein MMAD_21960 [Mycolicibacterium madagascariense]|uniref:Uncharacterized protein n=1 Tax=Mycolicibacterium madagascariense TaxID=212765 RepID=A0A7I7XFE0_9MYCO|nr:hypothetical protein MMAD_21960 [Mycolicibacterium madagascariense]
MIAKLEEMVRTTTTQAIASAMPSTESANRSGLRRIFASANRIRYPKVLPEAEAIAGDRTVVGAVESTAEMFSAACFCACVP